MARDVVLLDRFGDDALTFTVTVDVRSCVKSASMANNDQIQGRLTVPAVQAAVVGVLEERKCLHDTLVNIANSTIQRNIKAWKATIQHSSAMNMIQIQRHQRLSLKVSVSPLQTQSSKQPQSHHKSPRKYKPKAGEDITSRAHLILLNNPGGPLLAPKAHAPKNRHRYSESAAAETFVLDQCLCCRLGDRVLFAVGGHRAILMENLC